MPSLDYGYEKFSWEIIQRKGKKQRVEVISTKAFSTELKNEKQKKQLLTSIWTNFRMQSWIWINIWENLSR